MNKGYKNESSDDHTYIQKEKLNNKETKKSSDVVDQNKSDENFKENLSSSSQYDEKKLSKLSKIQALLRKSFIDPQKEPVSKFSDLKERFIWTIFMLFGFVGFISAGNFYCALLVFVVMIAIFSELVDMSKYREINQEIKYFYFLNWYF